MSDQKSYTCICGKIFDKPQSFNAHKSQCKEHHINKYGNLDNLINTRIKTANSLRVTNSKKRNASALLKEQMTQLELINWLSTNPKCEHCGTVMTHRYGSGRFCSSRCSHSRVLSRETKQTISSSVKLANRNKPKKLYFCLYCNSPLWSASNVQYCCESCRLGNINYHKLKRYLSKSTKDLYYYQCEFRFNIQDYPKLFSLTDIEHLSMYSVHSNSRNLNGLTLDHMYSRKHGFENNVDPYILSHPCNCEILTHTQNNSKGSKDSITLEELKLKITEFDGIYGHYNNIINYTGLSEFYQGID